jgi:hypothetical protein
VCRYLMCYAYSNRHDHSKPARDQVRAQRTVRTIGQAGVLARIFLHFDCFIEIRANGLAIQALSPYRA